MSSSPIRIWDIRRRWNVGRTEFFPRLEWAMSQGGPSLCTRCRDPSPWWHRARIAIRRNSIWISQEDTRRHAIRINSIRIPSGGHAPSCYPDSLREKHTALVNITLRTIAYPIRIGCADGKHWLKWANLAISFHRLPMVCPNALSGHLCHGFQRTLLNLGLLWW